VGLDLHLHPHLSVNLASLKPSPARIWTSGPYQQNRHGCLAGKVSDWKDFHRRGSTSGSARTLVNVASRVST
jgi:hypothetical protein